MPIERRTIIDTPAGREEWRRWRREDFVTASTVGALFDYHPFTSALRLYAAARGVEFIVTETKLMRKGRILEPSVPKAVMDERPHWKVESAGVYLRNPELRLGATPDFFVHDGLRFGVLQAKTTNFENYDREWANGEIIPEWIIDQTLTEALLAEAQFAAVAVLIVERYAAELHILDLPIDADRQAKILNAVVQFRDDVIAGREPQPSFDKDAVVVKALTPAEMPGKIINLAGNNEMPELLARRAALMARMDHDKAQCDVINTELKWLLGDAERAVGVPGWSISYKIQHRNGYTVAPSQPRVLLVTRKES